MATSANVTPFFYIDPVTYQFIPGTFDQVYNSLYNALLPTFPNSGSPDSPIYYITQATSQCINLLQSAIQVVSNAWNANTAGGIAQDILYSTVNNLTRNPLIKSAASVSLAVGNIYSKCTIQLTVTAVGVSPPYNITTGWQATSTTVTPTSPYTYVGTTISISVPGVYYFDVQSTDTSTAVPASAFDGGTAVTGLTFTVTNPSSAVLGSLTIPNTWYVTASSLGASSPRYYLDSSMTFTTAGTYVFNVFSDDVATVISPTQLNTVSNNYGGTLISVINPMSALLGRPAETDAQFAARRRYFLSIGGQSYAGLKTELDNLNTPGLLGLAVVPVISDTYANSICSIQVDINYTGTPVVIPVGWTVYGTTVTTAPYKTLQEYTFNASGLQYVPVYSTDQTTPVPIGDFTTADSPYPTEITSVTNLSPAVLQPLLGLGQRGTAIFLNYPTIPYSSCDITLTVTSVGVFLPYYIPVGWQATGPTTLYPYKTTESYVINEPGTYTVTVYSEDVTTAVPIGAFTGGAAVSGITFTATNLAAATLGETTPGQFDTNDQNLQQIAQTAAQYLPLGTQYYSGGTGATVFNVNVAGNYTQAVILTPYQATQISCNLLLIFNTNPADAASTSGVFDVSLLPNLQTSIQQLINQYFQAQSSSTFVSYSVKEVEQLIVQKYAGIVALIGNAGSYFSFGIVGGATGLPYLTQEDGYFYNLDAVNFNFVAINKDVYVP